MMMMLLISALLASGVAFGTSPRGRGKGRSACACSDPTPCRHDDINDQCLSNTETCAPCCATPGSCPPGVNCFGYVIGGPTSQDACCAAGTTHCGQPPVYTLMNEALSWNDASAACLAAGMELATVRSGEENALLVTAVAGNRAWIGGTDAAVEDTWVWSPSGTPLSYTNWDTGEPNNLQGDEDCLEVYGGGAWNDVPCSLKKKYVCQTTL